MRGRLYDCDSPTIQHASLSCKLSRTVNSKFSLLLKKERKIRFVQTVAVLFFVVVYFENGLEIKFYLVLLLLAGEIIDLVTLFA